MGEKPATHNYPESVLHMATEVSYLSKLLQLTTDHFQVTAI